MRIAYGLDVADADDKYYKMVERVAEIGGEVAIPGRFPVEALPMLRFLPSWFPGAGFKRFAVEAKREMIYTVNHLFDAAKAAMVSGTILSISFCSFHLCMQDRGDAKDSMVTRFFDNISSGDDQTEYAEHMMKEVAATTYVGMGILCLLMILYPS